MGLNAGERPRRDIRLPLRAAGIEVKNTNRDTFPRGVYLEGVGKLSEPDQEMMETVLERITKGCREYYAGYKMLDTHGNEHHDRRDERDKLRKQHGQNYDQYHTLSKLRLNLITRVYSPLLRLVYLLDAHDIHTDQAEKIRKIVSDLPSGVDVIGGGSIPAEQRLRLGKMRAEMADQGHEFSNTDKLAVVYHGMNDAQKVELMRRIDTIVARFLNTVTTDNGRSIHNGSEENSS